MNNCYRKTGFLKIESEMNCMPPDYYGVAYIDYSKGKAICYPLILNWIVWLFREIYYTLKYTPVINKLIYKNKILVGYFTDYNKTYFDIICVGFDAKEVSKKLKENANKTNRIDMAKICVSEFIY